MSDANRPFLNAGALPSSSGMSTAVLGIDTSGTSCSAALVRGDAVHARRAEVGNAHSTHLLAMIDAVLGEAGLALDDCAAVAFSAGPGAFTGLRVGCAVAQGLAFGADVPVAPVDTLEAILRAAVGDAPLPRDALVAHDARMGELYWSLFERSGDALVRVDGPALATPSRMAARLAARTAAEPIALGAGNGWMVHGPDLDGLVARIVPVTSADAVDVAWLGRRAFVAGRAVAADRALPVYVRDDVASTTAERAAKAREARSR